MTAPPYQPLSDCSESVQPCVERLNMILPYCPNPGVMIDIGCHTGWFCREFVKRGWISVGYDKSLDYLAIAQGEDRKANVGIKYLLGDVRDMDMVVADVALCLSTAMYLFEPNERGWDYFRYLSEACPLMFMDFGGMYADKLPFNERTVAPMFQAFTEYQNCQLIGRSDFESRPMFMLTR
jgi:SAM-dependent methyltransferase